MNSESVSIVTAGIANHLWQSTLCIVLVWLLALLFRKNSARVRYWLWLGASLKFLVPFSALALLGVVLFGQPDSGVQPVAPRVLALVSDVTAPLVPRVEELAPVIKLWDSTPAHADPAVWIFAMALLAWALGVAVVIARWLQRWISLRRTLRASAVIVGINFPVPARSSSTQMEPIVAGIFRPVLLLPAGMEERLTPDQIRAVLAHEHCHLRRRDNLTASVHMLVEALFWFYPPIWWIGARLIEERERDCDEQVLREGHAPESYAEGILRVCEHYIASRLACASGIGGADLRKRVEIIVRNPLVVRLSRSKKLVFAAIAGVAVVLPVAAGTVFWPAVRAYSVMPGTRTKSLYQLGMVQQIAVSNAYGDAVAAAVDAGKSRCTGRTSAVVTTQAALAATVGGLAADDGQLVLMYAVSANSVPDARRLLAAGAPRIADSILQPRSLIHVAARDGDAPMLQLLLDAGLDVEGRSTSQRSDPRWAWTPLEVAILTGRRDNAAWLVEHGAAVNAAGGESDSPLVDALICKDQSLVDMLLHAGALPGEQELKMATNLGLALATVHAAAAPRKQKVSHVENGESGMNRSTSIAVTTAALSAAVVAQAQIAPPAPVAVPAQTASQTQPAAPAQTVGKPRISAEQMIAMNDLNKDGIVTLEEAAKVNGNLFVMWAAYDLDHDGRVDAAEVTRATLDMLEGTALRRITGDQGAHMALNKPETVIANNDLNGDGIVTKEEATKANKALIKMWNSFDLDKDGKVDAAEIAKAQPY